METTQQFLLMLEDFLTSATKTACEHKLKDGLELVGELSAALSDTAKRLGYRQCRDGLQGCENWYPRNDMRGPDESGFCERCREEHEAANEDDAINQLYYRNRG